MTSHNIWYHSLLFRKKTKNLAAHKKNFYKTFQYSFLPSHQNRTKIKCSTHKSVKKIAKFFLSCNKIALGLSSLNQIIQCPSFWIHHLLYVPLSLNCKELYWQNTEDNLDSGKQNQREETMHDNQFYVRICNYMLSFTLSRWLQCSELCGKENGLWSQT